MLILLDHGSRTTERESSILYNILSEFSIIYTTLKLAAYQEKALGNTKYNNQDSGIPQTGFILVRLDHGSRTSESDPSVFYNLPGVLFSQITLL
jgi:hypothetical protein